MMTANLAFVALNLTVMALMLNYVPALAFAVANAAAPRPWINVLILPQSFVSVYRK